MKIRKELVLLTFRTFLFEGTENIKRGEWFKIVTGNGGTNNITPPKTVLTYEVFPSNNLELDYGWNLKECYILSSTKLVLIPKMRLLKKKKLTRYDNSPYGQMIPKEKKCSQTILIAGRLLVQWII
jgi:hypothetical protein